MSTTRSLLRISNSYAETFINEFGPILDALDEVARIQSEMGLSEDALASLSESDQNLFKSYLFLVESANSTMWGVLRLLSGNIFSDAYALLRIQYEIACLMTYGNSSPARKAEVYHSIYSSGLPEDQHRARELAVVRKARQLFEAENPDIKGVVTELNNFGSHISRAKIVLGNVAAYGRAAGAMSLQCNFRKNYFLMAGDFLYGIMSRITREYARHNVEYDAAPDTVFSALDKCDTAFVGTVRPELQSRMEFSGYGER